jgi:hypothetical protein
MPRVYKGHIALLICSCSPGAFAQRSEALKIHWAAAGWRLERKVMSCTERKCSLLEKCTCYRGISYSYIIAKQISYAKYCTFNQVRIGCCFKRPLIPTPLHYIDILLSGNFIVIPHFFFFFFFLNTF